jgi:hypothetical protein
MHSHSQKIIQTDEELPVALITNQKVIKTESLEAWKLEGS